MLTLPLLLSACTFQPGTGFAHLDGVSIEAALVPGEARDLGNDTVLTRLAYEVALARMDIAVVEVVLEEISGGSGGAFDPANPPEGYGLCHGGHCHAADGSLVSYAEIEAELAGGGASWSTVATLPVDLDLDLLAPEITEMTVVEPSPELPLAEIRRLRIRLGGLVVEGVVNGGDLDEPLLFLADLEGDLDLVSDLDLPIDRDQAPFLSLAVVVEPDGTLFDGLAFSSLAKAGTVSLESDDEDGAALLSALAATLPETTILP